MSTSVKNRVQLEGNVGKNPEVKVFENNNKVANFTVATSEYKKNKAGEFITETTWHNISAWGKQAEIAEKTLVKGSRVSIDGKITNRTYTDKEGNKRYFTEIVANEVTLIAKKKKLRRNINFSHGSASSPRAPTPRHGEIY
ncbi:MAG: single-stranded DNA-binding protein [Sphingobacteriaceae bacterium]|nr:single-stranded DNA-binding protein [Sphingobacteriaceae bacterium]